MKALIHVRRLRAGHSFGTYAMSHHETTSRSYHLTEKKTDVAKHVASGMTNKEIAWYKGVSEQTIKNRLTAVYNKVGVDNRTQLVVALNGGPFNKPGDRKAQVWDKEQRGYANQHSH